MKTGHYDPVAGHPPRCCAYIKASAVEILVKMCGRNQIQILKYDAFDSIIDIQIFSILKSQLIKSFLVVILNVLNLIKYISILTSAWEKIQGMNDK